MAASTKYIDAELHARGITDVTKEEAFRAWTNIFALDTDHAVILRTLPLDADATVPHPILNDCVTRSVQVSSGLSAITGGTEEQAEPASGPELEAFLLAKVTRCVAETLSLEIDAVDAHAAMSELGLDSVMTVELRGQLQKALKVKVGPTLVWNCPTVALLVKHFVEVKSK